MSRNVTVSSFLNWFKFPSVEEMRVIKLRHLSGEAEATKYCKAVPDLPRQSTANGTQKGSH